MPDPEPKARRASPQKLSKHSVTIAGHRTSLSLERAFWDALTTQARAEGLSRAALIEKIDRCRDGNLSSAVRVYILQCRGHPANAEAENDG